MKQLNDSRKLEASAKNAEVSSTEMIQQLYLLKQRGRLNIPEIASKKSLLILVLMIPRIFLDYFLRKKG